jgi:acyl-homoserine lactone acylase PvdQ
MFCLYPSQLKNKVTRRSTAGHAYVAIVEFGKTVKARSIVPYGNTRDINSKHYFDQAALYAEGKFKDVLFTDEEIKRAAVSSYHPGENYLKNFGASSVK